MNLKGVIMKEIFTREQLREIGQGYRKVPLILRVEARDFSPSSYAKRFASDAPLFFLESADTNVEAENNRYSYLGEKPELILSVLDGFGHIRYADGREESFTTDDPSEMIEKILDEHRSPDIPGLPPFTGGFAGSFSFEFFKYAEPVLNFNNPNPDELDDINLMYFNTLFAYDHVEGALYLITNIDADFTDEAYTETKDALMKSYLNLLEMKPKEPGLEIIGEIDYGKSEEEYAEVVRRVKEYIRAGDIFQCVPSNRLRAEVTPDSSLFPVYERLRENNPSPYMYYLNFGDFQAAGSSPETLLRKSGHQLLTVPIAGTRPRGATKEEDMANERSLLDDPKELAEHNMLVDLARNDIGKIAKIGSIRVADYLHIKRFSNVMHLCTDVTGTIRDDLSCLDVLAAMLPAGTLSGAPKIRACEIIEELEEEKRGLYGGSSGYIGANGNMDMCIAIRTAFKKNDQVIIQSGGGIVADSVESTEFMETRHKARPVIRALEEAV